MKIKAKIRLKFQQKFTIDRIVLVILLNNVFNIGEKKFLIVTRNIWLN